MQGSLMLSPDSTQHTIVHTPAVRNQASARQSSGYVSLQCQCYVQRGTTSPRRSCAPVLSCMRRAQLGDHVRPTALRLALATADSPARVAPVTNPTPCAGS